ncbi:DUF2892 domain-containing protein, partial [Dysosmobacter welbionis]
AILQVRQIHLYLPLQTAEGLRFLIAAAVPHHRHGPFLVPQGLQNRVGEVGGGHQVQAGGLLSDQLVKDL